MALKYPKGYLVLEDGSVYPGFLFGDAGLKQSVGEVVFNTAMAGYEEVLTDPSYCGQIVLMTYPHQGNYGITLQDAESDKVHVSGFVVRELCEQPSSWRSRLSLSEYLKKRKVLGIWGVDSRALTLKLRSLGVLRGMIVAAGRGQAPLDAFIQAVRNHPSMEGLALAGHVSVAQQALWQQNASGNGRHKTKEFDHKTEIKPKERIAVWDFGVKASILRHLSAFGRELMLFPYRATAQEILAIHPAAIVLSNGPGDPAALTDVIGQIRFLLSHGERPWLFGICLGHQLLGLACGVKTYKMKFGHHGVNHPVKDLASGRVWISSHNHGFAVDGETLPADVKATHISLNDGTLEGIFSEERRFMAVQFHPESAPGPWEAQGVFKSFYDRLEQGAPSAF